jgi:hypothetical protein
MHIDDSNEGFIWFSVLDEQSTKMFCRRAFWLCIAAMFIMIVYGYVTRFNIQLIIAIASAMTVGIFVLVAILIYATERYTHTVTYHVPTRQFHIQRIRNYGFDDSVRTPLGSISNIFEDKRKGSSYCVVLEFDNNPLCPQYVMADRQSGKMIVKAYKYLLKRYK